MKRKVLILVERGYKVTKEGELFNKKGVKVGSVQGNYHRIGVRVKSKKVYIHTHRFQAYQKYGNKLFEENIVVRHKNGNPLDNSWDNILIGTQLDNIMDRPVKDRLEHAKHAASFNKKYDYDSILNDRNKGMTYRELMNKYNISSKGTIGYIIKNAG